MNTLRTIIVVSTCLIGSLWWAVSATGDGPEILPATSVTQQWQCPPGSRATGKLCTCDPGSEWTGSQCTATPPPASQPRDVPGTLPGPVTPEPDTRHVTTVDLRRR